MTSQGIYYLIRALVALVAIPSTSAATRWRHGCWATTPQSGRGGFR